MQKEEQIVLSAYCLDLNWSTSYSNTLRIMTQKLTSAGQVKMDLSKIFTIVIAWYTEKNVTLESNRRTCFLILIISCISFVYWVYCFISIIPSCDNIPSTVVKK